jgi:hypothetical protein
MCNDHMKKKKKKYKDGEGKRKTIDVPEAIWLS